VSGGADDFKPIDAWFRTFESEQRVIHTCYDRAPTFGVDAPTLEKMITDAFKSWGDYIQIHRLLGPSRISIMSTLDLRSQCQGDEDLKFYFGTENPQVIEGEENFEHPYGFAEFTGNFDHGNQPLWGKGFVWILNLSDLPDELGRPGQRNWLTYQPSLAGLILHEVGHVFGNGHEDGTVMTVSIGQYIDADTKPAGYQTPHSYVPLYTTIDSQIELLECPSCHTVFPAAAVFNDMSDPIANPQGDWKTTFQMLTGKVAVPPLSIQYERIGTSDGSGKITVADATGSYSFPVQGSDPETMSDSTPVFGGLDGKTFYTTASQMDATITSMTGQALKVRVETNVKDHKSNRQTGHKVKVILRDDSTYPPNLFVSDDPS